MTQKTIYQIFGVKEASHETDNMELCYDVELGNTTNEHRKVQIYRDLREILTGLLINRHIFDSHSCRNLFNMILFLWFQFFHAVIPPLVLLYIFAVIKSI